MIQFAKLLDVISINYVGDEQDLSNVGYDMFVPKFNNQFLEFLEKANFRKNSNSKMYITQLPKKEDDLFTKYNILQNNTFVGIITIYDNEKDGISYMDICRNISIPNGHMFLLPKNHYGELCTRSSNFPQDTEVTLGYIDNSYTFGSCFQIKIIEDNTTIKIYENEKIAQMILREYVKPETKELSLVEFEQLEEVKYRRKLRDGGFGSTGRFLKK